MACGTTAPTRRKNTFEAARLVRAIFDTNVLIDFLLDRAPFADAAADLLSRADRGEIQGLVCANSIATISATTTC